MYIDSQDQLTTKIAEQENTKRHSQRKSKFSSIRANINMSEYIFDPENYEIVKKDESLKGFLHLFQLRNLLLTEQIEKIFHASTANLVDTYASQFLQKFQINVDLNEISLKEFNPNFQELQLEFDTGARLPMEKLEENVFQLSEEKIPEGAQKFRLIGINEDKAEHSVVPIFAQEIEKASDADFFWASLQKDQENYHFQHKRTPSSSKLVLHTASKSHKFKEIQAELASIRQQGYNAVQVSTTQNDAQGLPLHLFAINKSQGSLNDLYELIDEAHNQELKVLLSINHSKFSSDKASFNSTWKPKHFIKSQGQNGVRPNYKEFEILSILLANLEYFEEQFDIDGFVFEHSDAIIYQNQDPSKFKELKDFYDESNLINEGMAYLILANDCTLSKAKQNLLVRVVDSGVQFPHFCGPVNQGNLGFDYQLKDLSKTIIEEEEQKQN